MLKEIAEILEVPVELLLIDFDTVINILSTFFIRLKTSSGIMNDVVFSTEINTVEELKKILNDALIELNQATA